MPPLKCNLTGQDMVSGYWSPASGLIYEKQTLEAHLERSLADPLNGKPLQRSQLVPIQATLTVDSFAGAVSALYGEISSLKANLKEHQDQLEKGQPRADYGSTANASTDLIKKTYEARLENLAKTKDQEIRTLHQEVERLQIQQASMEAEHKARVRDMIGEVRKREKFWTDTVATLEKQLYETQQPPSTAPAPSAPINTHWPQSPVAGSTPPPPPPAPAPVAPLNPPSSDGKRSRLESPDRSALV